ncbi:MAG TPA: hypothetical protein VGN20_20195 [Mucilaginibacter sp.]|jgi:hypothetical protein
MDFKFKKRKWHKISSIVLLVLASLIVIMVFLVNSYWAPVLAKKVKEVVLKSSDGLYIASFSSAELHVIRGSIIFYNVTLKPDTAIYNAEKRLHVANNNLIELHVKRLILSHVHPFRLYFQHKLDIDEIVLNEPELHVSYQLNHVKDTVLKDHRTYWQKISKNLQSIHIGSIKLGDVKFRYEDYSGNKVAISELKEMNLSAYDLLIDSATQTDKSRLLYCKDIIAELNDYTGKTPNGLYTYKIKSVKLSTLKSQLSINNLTLKPVKTEEFFNKSTDDRFTLRIDSMRLNHFDFLNYHKYRILNATSLDINGGAIQIFTNPNKHKNQLDKIKTFPHVALSTLNADMKIDTIHARHINILYNEYNKKSDQVGSVIFNNTSGYFLNVTTNKAALQKTGICTAQLSSHFMNQGKLDVAFSFNLNDEENAFSYKGSLGLMDLKFVNPAAIPLAMVKITSGTLKRFTFDIKANRNGDKGKVEVLYNDLKVIVLKPDTAFDRLKQKPIATLYANLFILKHNNPDITGGMPRTAYVDYARAPETSFFKSIWQTLFSGIKPCAGLDAKMQKAVVDMTNQQLIKKQNHKIKKEQRIERRRLRQLKRLLKSKELSAETSN